MELLVEPMTRPEPLTPARRAAAELALLLAMGLFMGAIGPYGTATIPAGRKYAYWILCIVGGGAIGIAIDEALGRRAGAFWRRLAVTTLAMTPAVTLLVLVVGRLLIGQSLQLLRYLELLWQVFVICVPVMALRPWCGGRPGRSSRPALSSRRLSLKRRRLFGAACRRNGARPA